VADFELPVDYAPSRVRDRLLPWWRGAAGDAVRTYGPIIWPGMPPVALLAWSITATGPTERGPEPDHVRGLWGVERSRLDELARDARPYLNREVRIGVEERDYLRDLEAQCVVGLLGYKKHFDDTLEDVAPRVREALGRSTGAAWRVAAVAYSSGDRVAATTLNAWPEELAEQPVQKWPVFLCRRSQRTPPTRLKRPPALAPCASAGNGARRTRGACVSSARARRCALAEAVLPPLEAAGVVRWVDDWTRRPSVRRCRAPEGEAEG
jgi:hypothetical protein